MKTYTVCATIGGRTVRDAGLTVEGKGRGRAVVSFDEAGELRRFPLDGRTVEEAVAAVGLLNLRDTFKGPLSGVVRVESYDQGRILTSIVETARDFRAISAADFFGAAGERLREARA